METSPLETDTLSPSELRVDANAGFTGLRASTWSLTVPGDHKLQTDAIHQSLEPRTVNPGTGEWTVPQGPILVESGFGTEGLSQI